MSGALAGLRLLGAAVPYGGPRWIIASQVEQSARRWAVVWGAVSGLLVIATVKGFVSLYPTVAARNQLASSLQSFAALLGPPHHAETVAGFTTWRVLTAMALIGGIWGLLTSTGLLRGQEDGGQWELLLAGQTTRRRAAAQALLGLGAALAEMFVVTALLTLAAGNLPGARFPLGGSFLFAAALVSGAALFLAVGALTSQVYASRGQATMMGGAVLGASYLLRVVADSRTDLGWLRWVTPLGWIEEIRPLRDSQPLALVPIVLAIALCAGLTITLAGRRDLQAGILRENESHLRDARWLVGPTSLALRVTWPVALGWLAGIATLGLVYGLLARSAANVLASSPAILAALGRLGAHKASESFLGAMFLMVSVLISVIAAGQIASIREEESSSRLDNLLVQPVRRLAWLGGRIAISLSLVVLAGAVVGYFTWLGAASQHNGIPLSALVEAGLNAVAPGIFVFGSGILVLGLRPRLCVTASYGIVTWSFLVDLLGSLLKRFDWLRDSSVFTHISLAPSAQPDWGNDAIIVTLGLVAMALGAVAFQRRDLQPA